MNAKGQMTIEMLLLLALMVGVMISVSKASQESKWMQTIVSGPWKPLQGMIEDGVWLDPKVSRGKNPTMRYRHGSYEGEKVE